MCMIITKPSGHELPDRDYIRNSDMNNSDGTGIAYWKHGTKTVKIKKDFESINEVLSFIEKNITKDDSLVIHCRFATHGKVDKGNRHPFPVTNDKPLLRRTELSCKMALAHNGVLSQYNAGKKYSDSQKFVWEIMSSPQIKNNLNDKAVQKLVNNFLGGDRLSILTNEGDIYMFGEHNKADDDCFYSNTGYSYGYRVVGNNTDFYGYGYSTQKFGNVLEDDKDENIEKRYDSEGKELLISHDETFKGKCDCCNDWKELKDVEYDDEYKNMCDDCIDMIGEYIEDDTVEEVEDDDVITELNDDNDELIQCENCFQFTEQSELLEIYGGHLVCKRCKRELANAEEQGNMDKQETNERYSG